MSDFERTVREFKRTLTGGRQKTSPLDIMGKVTRVEDGVAWVRFAGSEIGDTPVRMNMDCKEGDDVQVRSSGGKAWIVGNQSAPPTDDTTATYARERASIAQWTAVEARGTAIDAQGTAVDAKGTAIDAQETAVDAKGTAIDAQETAVDAKGTAIDAQETAASTTEALNDYAATNDSIVNSLQDTVNGNPESGMIGLLQRWAELDNYIEFGVYIEDGVTHPILILGKRELNDFTARLRNDKLEFVNKDMILAYLSGNALHVQQRISFGNYEMYQRNTGHFSIRYISGGDD